MRDGIWEHFEARVERALRTCTVSPIPSVLSPYLRELSGSGCIGSDVEMQQFLDELLALVVRDHEFRSTPPVWPSSQDRKWRYSSAFQKAVRRNDLSITPSATALEGCDPGYFWRRAPTIALEDIGLGDPWVCAVVLHACRFAKVRARYGRHELASVLGELMGSAVKDRLSCDSFCLPYFHPELADERAAVDGISLEERAELYRSDHTPFGCRVAAGIALAGPRYGQDAFEGSGGSSDRFAEAVQGLVPYPIQWLSRQYAKMARDGMFVSLPLVWRQLILEGQATVAPCEMPKRCLIDGVLTATFDGHTQEGRRAISYFGKSCEPVRGVIADHPQKHKVLALAVFTVDSSLLDRQITSPWATELYKENLRGEVLAAGASTEQFYELIDVVRANLDRLDHARRQVTR